MATISLVMIVKNEELILQRCIDSVKNIVDEFVICDTGSTDNTKEIIQAHGKLFEIPFVNYVDTKNEALRKATCDYILLMDADEYVLHGLEKLKAYAEEGVNAVSAKIIEGTDKITVNEYYRNRLWRNNGQWRFEGPGVHEVVCGPGDIIYAPDIKVRHDHNYRQNNPEIVRAKSLQYINLLNTYLVKNPNNPRALFYLARTYKDLGETTKTIDIYHKYLNTNSSFLDERWQAAFDIALCWKSIGEYDKAFEACDLAIGIDERRAEAYNLKGLLYYNMHNWQKAADYFEESLKKSFPSNVLLFINPREYNFVPLDYLSICYDRMKQYHKSKELLGKYIEISKVIDNRIVENLCWTNRKIHQKIFMALGHTPEPVYGGILNEKGVHGVETTYIELSKDLVDLGHTVFLFCSCEEEHKYDGVYYIPYTKINQYISIEPDLVVASRWFNALRMFPKAKKIIWMQDALFRDPDDLSLYGQVDKIICSSKWHSQYIAERLGTMIDYKKVQVIPLGIRKELFAANIGRDPYKVIYSSNPDRGLYILIDMWERLTKAIPEIKLDIYYGWEGLKTWSNTAEWQSSVKDQQSNFMDKIKSFTNIDFKGRLTKKQLADEMLSASLCLYPNNFWETFALTAIEAQAAGVPMITTDKGALATTLNLDCNVLIRLDPYSKEYQDVFIKETTDLLTDSPRRELWSGRCREYAMSGPFDWTDISEQWHRLIMEL